MWLIHPVLVMLRVQGRTLLIVVLGTTAQCNVHYTSFAVLFFAGLFSRDLRHAFTVLLLEVALQPGFSPMVAWLR